MEGAILIPAIYRGSQDLADKSKKLVFGTNEVTPAQASSLQLCVQEFVYLAIKREPFLKQEIELINDLKTDYEDVGKSPSQRLRAVLFRLWQQAPEGYDDFNLFYIHKLEGVIGHFKSFLV